MPADVWSVAAAAARPAVAGLVPPGVATASASGPRSVKPPAVCAQPSVGLLAGSVVFAQKAQVNISSGSKIEPIPKEEK